MIAVLAVSTLVATVLSACGARRTEPQEDIEGRLAKVAAAGGTPSYFLGRSFAGIELTTVEPPGYRGSLPGEGAYFEYGTCEYDSDGGCAPPIQVQNNTEHLTGTVVGCRRLPDIRGLPAIAWGGGLTVFTRDSSVTLFSGDDPPPISLRRMAEALRPADASAASVGPLPPPSPGVRATIARECRMRPALLR